MRHALLAMFAMSLAFAARAEAAPGRVEFEILRNGRVEGRHVVDVAASGAGYSVRSDIRIDVRFGPVTVYRYAQNCRETWAADALSALTCTTNRNGRGSAVAARRAESGLIVTGAGAEARFDLAALPTSWWVKPPTRNTVMIDTQTGAPMEVRVTRIGRENLTIGGRAVAADHIRVQGSTSVDLWYDTDGRWIGCRFTASGQSFEYRLVSPIDAGPTRAAA